MADKTTFGPGYFEWPSMQITPSRDNTPCPLCKKPVDLHKRHAIVDERFNGQLVAGRYAHLACAEKKFTKVEPVK